MASLLGEGAESVPILCVDVTETERFPDLSFFFADCDDVREIVVGFGASILKITIPIGCDEAVKER